MSAGDHVWWLRNLRICVSAGPSMSESGSNFSMCTYSPDRGVKSRGGNIMYNACSLCSTSLISHTQGLASGISPHVEDTDDRVSWSGQVPQVRCHSCIGRRSACELCARGSGGDYPIGPCGCCPSDKHARGAASIRRCPRAGTLWRVANDCCQGRGVKG